MADRTSIDIAALLAGLSDSQPVVRIATARALDAIAAKDVVVAPEKVAAAQKIVVDAKATGGLWMPAKNAAIKIASSVGDRRPPPAMTPVATSRFNSGPSHPDGVLVDH